MIGIEEFRNNAISVIDLICDYFKNVEKYPVLAKVAPNDIRKQLPIDPPQSISVTLLSPHLSYCPLSLLFPIDGEEFKEIEKDLHNIIIPGLTHWQHPNFFAYFPCATSFPALLGDMLCSGLGVQGMMWVYFMQFVYVYCFVYF